MAPSGGLTVGQPRVQPKSFLSHVRWEHLAAGVSGGVVSTLVLHPLDLIKIRFQVNEGIAEVASLTHRPQYQGIMDAFRTISRTEGIKGLYQGVTPNVWGAGASWGLYFLFYSSFKTFMQQGSDSKILTAAEHMWVATEAGVVTLILTNPVWVAKTRLCLQYEGISRTSTPSTSSNIYYRGMFDCLTKIYRTEGIRGLYRGFTPGLMGVSHGSLQFMAYEELKKMYNKHRKMPLDTKFGSAEYLCFAALSKIFAALVTYPYQVLRARLQDQHRSYDGMMDVIKQTWNKEGWRGFYKGLFLGLIRVTPACCITFVVYENMIAYLMKHPLPPLFRSHVHKKDTPEAVSDSSGATADNKVAVKKEDVKEK